MYQQLVFRTMFLTLAMELDSLFWMKWAAQEMRPTWLTALTVGLVSTTVHILRMQEYSVIKVVKYA